MGPTLTTFFVLFICLIDEGMTEDPNDTKSGPPSAHQRNTTLTLRLLRTRERKFVQNGPGHMTKMAATPMYGKTL